MKLKNIIPQSAFGTIATIKYESCLTELESFLINNQDVVSSFKHIVVAVNKMQDTTEDIVAQYYAKWKEYHPNVEFIMHPINRGHMLGTIDLEEAILKHIKSKHPEIKYLWKSMSDVLISPAILDAEVADKASFLFLPSISLETLEQNSEFLPQTTFYIIDITKIDNLYGDDVETKWTHYSHLKTANPALKPWEVSFDLKFDCETHLARTVKNMKSFCLIEKELIPLCEYIKQFKVGDPSHKNIYFNRVGLCHYHFYGQSCVMI